MNQSFISNHFTDHNGMPAGGTTYGPGLSIGWQNGPLGRGENREAPNGCFVETVISAAVDRLEFYQASRFHCEENARALVHLKAALQACEERTAKREARQVEGTHAV